MGWRSKWSTRVTSHSSAAARHGRVPVAKSIVTAPKTQSLFQHLHSGFRLAACHPLILSLDTVLTFSDFSWRIQRAFSSAPPQSHCSSSDAETFTRAQRVFGLKVSTARGIPSESIVCISSAALGRLYKTSASTFLHSSFSKINKHPRGAFLPSDLSAVR